MSYFDDASLVMIPSGYKTSKVYSVKPIDGTGDLTFTRASTATRVNASGLVESVSSNVPRLDYLNSSCPRLILEPSRTNLILQSEALNTTWIPEAAPTITANTTVAPDGATTGDTIAATAASSGVYQVLTVANGVAHSFSVYLKNISSATNVLIGCDTFPSNAKINFNTVTGAIIATGASITSSSVTNAGNGWYRVQGTYTSTGVGNTFIIYGQGVMSFSAWGAQVEAGAYVTSYIPTTTAAVTRLADTAVDSAASSLIGQTEGTIYAEVNFDSNVNTEGYIVRLDDTSFNDTVVLSRGNDKRLNAILRAGGSTIVNIQQDNFNGVKRVAFAYKSGSFAVYVDGAQVGTSAATYTNGITYGEVRIGGFDASTANMSGGISQILLFKTRLTNAQLAELTTI
jgi:hypothetical protein